jgi:hypothetical protein
MERKIDTVPDSSESPPETVSDRRRHARHRYVRPVVVWFKDGSAHSGMSFEMSQSGLSAVINDKLRIGAQVELSTIIGYRLSAVVRRKSDKFYGFEFINLTEEQSQKLADHCAKLPLFSSMLDI